MSEDVELDSAKERRRRQNRLNQQARRKRLGILAQAQGPARKWIIYSAGLDENEKHDKVASSPSIEKWIFCQSNGPERSEFLKRLQDAVTRDPARPSFDAQLLTNVTQFNIIKAMAKNAAYFGFTLELLCEDLISPFNASGPAISASGCLPPSLAPTAVQKQIVHHPWIDVCPIPSLRNAMLLNAGTYDEDELCNDLFTGSGSDSEHQVGFVVWGESWDPAAYEISEVFALKWQKLLRMSVDVVVSTNYWRSRRGQAPIRLQMGSA
ncbi:hypothetical protein CCM_09333 [Cordyceps militaris CM01]|uniref:BZIP domain-containing protein n=1 Tax=Cordyceps militaris (strain CM01) TaxID=983644 RepID=G3JU43_CORMM|nr:uncharacterized protein CCM_09333 [Cordyceps militaris CM01]EGX88197.1 hypothetical protein CCM_09333 [Cordyceps militaris CM01]